MAIQHLASPLSTGPYVRPSKLNVFIIDVSGSMAWTIKRLAQDVAGRLRLLPLHDAVLIGIFSSPGFYRWVAARSLDTPEEYETVCAMVERELYARNTTCFSEILADVPKALAPFMAGYQVITMTFMSDGCAVVPDVKLEYAAVDAATVALKPILTSGVVVSYGDYADLKLLQRMAGNMGIEFLATDRLADIGEAFSRQSVSTAKERRSVPVPEGQKIVFTTEEDGSVIPLEPQNGAVLVSDTADVYTIPHDGPASAWVPQAPHDLVYSAALGYVRQGKVDDALELLSAIGDVAIVRTLSNALTNAELATVEGLLQNAVVNDGERFTDGREPGCLPTEDAFDLMDLLHLLMDDPEAKFYPRHEGFRYKRIGRAATQAEGYPMFTAFAEEGVPLAGLTGNKEELNLSVRVSIPGSIPLPERCDRHDALYLRPASLPEVFPTSIWRNYALIANAMPVVTKLPVTLSEATYRKLCDVHLIRHRQKYDPARVEVLDLTRIPVCNKARGQAATDWDRMATLSLTSLRLGCFLKVFKAKVTELDPSEAGKQPMTHTDEEYRFLSACGIRRDGSYSPPVTEADPTDELQIRVMEVTPKHSSPVSMTDFQKMLDGKKKWNYVGELMREAHRFMFDHWNLVIEKSIATRADALAWLYGEISTLTREKRQIDAELNARRFAVALTGGWAQSFSEKEVEHTSAGHPVVLSFDVATKHI